MSPQEAVEAPRFQTEHFYASFANHEFVAGKLNLEARIAKLQEQLASARVIEKREISKDVVSVGSTVRLRDVDARQTVEYRIVGSAEANPAENKLSNESPVGKAIIGKKKGETVEVSAPRGTLKYKILEIKAA